MRERDAALKALTLFVERGDQAIEALVAAEIDRALELLHGRDAAFHNYRSVEHLAVRAGWSPEGDSEAQELLKSAAASHSRLAKALEDAKIGLGRKGRKMAAVRQYADACHSRTGRDPRLVKIA